MADRFYNYIEIPDLPTGYVPPLNDPSFIKLYAKEGKLIYFSSENVEVQVGAGGGSSVPTLVTSPDVFEVAVNTQVLFKKRIKLEDGARIKLSGILVEV